MFYYIILCYIILLYYIILYDTFSCRGPPGSRGSRWPTKTPPGPVKTYLYLFAVALDGNPFRGGRSSELQ